MTNETRVTVVAHAVRWAANMILEVLGNHGHKIGESNRKALRMAVENLSQFNPYSEDIPT